MRFNNSGTILSLRKFFFLILIAYLENLKPCGYF